MKKNILIVGVVLFTFLISQLSKAQNKMVNWGTAHSTISKFDEPTILGEVDQFVFTYTIAKNDRYINKYDKVSLALIYKKEIKLPLVDKLKGEIGSVRRLGNKVYVFAQYLNRKERFYYVYAFELDINTGVLKSDPKQLVKAEYEDRKASGLDYLLMVSEDKTKIVFNYYARHAKQKIFVDKYVLMGHNLNVITEKEEQNALESMDYSSSDYIIDNEGSIYFLKRYKNGTTSIVSFDANKDYEKWEEQIDIAKNDREIKGIVNNVKFTISKENNLVVSGFYSDGGDLKGVFYLKIDNFTKETLVSKVTTFTQVQIDELHVHIGQTIKKKDKDKPKKLQNDFNNVSVLQKEDGGTIMSGELYSYIITYDRQGGIQGEKKEYNGIVIVNLSKEGELIWAKGIVKKQYYGYSNFLFTFGSWGLGFFSWRPEIPDYFSYLDGFYNGKLFVFFNDNPSNHKANTKKMYTLKEPKKSCAALYSFDINTGESIKTQIFNKKEYPFKIKPRVSYQASENSNLYLYAQKGGKCRLGVIPQVK